MKNPVRRENLYLLELVCCLFIFAVSAGVCVGLLLHARSLSRESTQLTDAVYAAQSAASQWQADALREELWRSGDGAALIQCLDAQGRPLPAGQEGYYTLTLTELPQEAGVRTARIDVAHGDHTIFELRVSRAGEVDP